MKRHIEHVHRGKKPFKFDSCDSSFTETGEFKTDKDSFHEGKWPFKCEICNINFSQADNQ